ncbi:MAG TPA: helix-turn-helix domain-containing protein [Myxococcales bacterium]
MTSLAAAVGELLKQVSDRNTPAEPTAGVEEAARLLKTTPGGIYALHARGKLPPSIGPGRRLIWRTADLLQCRARRASSPEKGERR